MEENEISDDDRDVQDDINMENVKRLKTEDADRQGMHQVI